MHKESIAIIGIGCRFPSANNPNDFWQVLRNGVDTITEAPNDRQIVLSGWGGFLNRIDKFDAEFFGIPHQKAVTIDPQHRLLLEVTWEALEDAGQIPEKLAGTNTGVFAGISASEYHQLVNQQQAIADIDASTGNHSCMLANRISYHFDFRGPSLTINTACSSSLVAFDRACQSLWTGETSLALAAGINLIISPEITARFVNAGLIAADGRCKSFDAKADGYVRSEGVGVVVLKPLSQAIADGDRIYAVIRGSAVNHNGRSNGLTAPNMQAQIDLLQRAYQQAGIAPSSIHYIEAQGTATPIGDVLEMKALGAVVGKNRTPDNPCRVGCVKTNIGHTEAAAGIAGLIKVVLSLHHRQIPANLHFQQPNPNIPFAKLGLKVQQTLESLPLEMYPIRASVSAFGFGGTNAHVILEEAPTLVKAETNPDSFPLQILTLTAKSQTALQELARRYQAFLNNQRAASLADICFTANTRRSQFKHRLAIITESKEQLSDQLNAYIQKESLPSVLSSQVNRKKPAPICFVFSGQSSKYRQIIPLLYKSQPALRSSLEQCEAILYSCKGKLLLEILDQEYLDSSPHSQLVDFLFEYALAQLWKSWGIEPAICIGYGIGQYVAATIAGILSLEDTISIILKEGNLELITLNLQRAKIPIVSSVTGNVTQVNQTISLEQFQNEFDFSNSYLHELPNSLSDLNYILLYVFSSQIKHSELEKTDCYDINSDSLSSLFSTLIKLWLMGIKVDWSRVGDYKQCHPISLPTYPFEHQSYWISSRSEISINTLLLSSNNEIARQATPSQDISKSLDKEFLAPRDEVEQQLADIWQKTLGHKSIGINDNFFELGGTSHLSALLVSEVEKAFNRHLSLASFFQFPTIAEIAQFIRQSTVASPKIEFSTSLDQKDYQKLLTYTVGRPGLRPNPNSLMVSLTSNQNKRPFFFCTNSMEEASPLSKYLGQEQSFYFLESGYMVFVEENRITDENIKAIASHHVHDILTIQPEGEYLLGGFCFGSLVAYEIAKQLQEKGKKVAFLAILDMYGNNFRLSIFWKLTCLVDRLRELTKLIITVNVAGIPEKTRICYRELLDFIRFIYDNKSSILTNVVKKYPVQGYQGKITLFLAQERINSCLNHKLTSWLFPRYGWTKESVHEVHQVPGSHTTMALEPHVKVLAEKLAFYLAHGTAASTKNMVSTWNNHNQHQ